MKKLLPLLLLATACGREEGDPIPELPDDVAAQTRCIGSWFQTFDGVPVAEGHDVLDAEDRLVEQETDLIGSEGGDHAWQVWDLDASGTDRVVEASYDSDGDDEADQFSTYAYELDDRLRLVSEATFTEGAPDDVTTYTYDDDDQLVEIEHTSGGEWRGHSRSTWEEGRLVKTENFGPAGEPGPWGTRDYVEPSPSLDHVQTSWWGPEEAYVTRVDYDAADQLLAQWNVDDAGETLVLTQAWDDEGRLVEAVAAFPTGVGWGYDEGETRTTWTYGDDGRIRTERTEEDALADGTAEHAMVTEWSWFCE